MRKLSDKQFWDEVWINEKRATAGDIPENYLFNPLLRKYLPQGGTFLEIGSAPGTFLANFAKHFQYRVSGIDYSSVPIIKETLEHYGIADYDLYEADFTEFETDKKFDVVASFGFVEHFVEYDAIIAKQASFVDDNGYLVVELPNIRYFNYLLFRMFNPELLKIHNYQIMDDRELKKSVEALQDFTLLHCDYYKSCFLFFNEQNAEIAKRPLLRKIFVGLRWLLQKLGLENIPNRFFSPYLILIARKIK